MRSQAVAKKLKDKLIHFLSFPGVAVLLLATHLLSSHAAVHETPLVL